MVRILIVLFVVAVIAGGGYWYWTTTPQFSISQIKDAIKTHDKEKFDKHVDVDEFSSGMVDDVLTGPMREMLGGGMIGRIIVGGLSGFIKPNLVAGITEDLHNFVEKGNFSDPEDDRVVSLGSLDKRLSLKSHTFKRIEQIKVDGKVAKVTVILHNEKHNKDLPLDVQMRDLGGYWQVTKMLNFPEFVSKLIELETAHPEKRENEPAAQVSP